MLQRLLLLSIFLISQCSIYDLNDNPMLNNLFPTPESPEASIVELISPIISASPLITDVLTIRLHVINTNYGVKSIKMQGDTFSTNINLPQSVDKLYIETNIVLSNIENYHTDKKIYHLNINIDDGLDNSTITNFTIPVCIASVFVENLTYPETAPITQNGWDNSQITLKASPYGAKIKSIQVSGNIIGSSDVFTTNILEPTYDEISIPFSMLSSSLVVEHLLTANIRITSSTDTSLFTNFLILR